MAGRAAAGRRLAWQAALCRRSRAVHQRTGRGGWRVLWPGRAGHRRAAAGRADDRWRLELRAGARLDTRLVPHHDLRARGAAGVERATGGSPAVTAARERRQAYLLERRMFRRLSSGEVIEQAWTQFSFPTGYHYDVLRGLDYLRSASVRPDARMAEAIELVASKRDADGRWPLENAHPDQLDAEPGVEEGQPSRWNTLRALRVLDWYAAGA